METLVGRHYKEDHYHDASEHGFAWALLNELLHVIVFVYTLYGMIQFKVKFIHQIRLVRALSIAIIAHSWYLALKFALIAIVLYLFNDELEARSISWQDYNCSLENHDQVFQAHGRAQMLVAKQTVSNQLANNGTTLAGVGGDFVAGPGSIKYATISSKLKYLTDLFIEPDYPKLWANFLHIYGGPFKLLGNRSTLMYGFYSIAIYIMLAIFPIELMYLRVGFNFIRFVLNDTSCMGELYTNRRRHLNRLASWSRNQTDSELTLGSKNVLNQPDIRTRFSDDYDFVTASQLAGLINDRRLVSGPKRALLVLRGVCLKPFASGQVEPIGRDKSKSSAAIRGRTRLIRGKGNTISCSMARMSRFVMADQKLATHLRPMRTRLAINHTETPSYSVKVANKNLQKFKPFVRSETWFKSSMIFYPMAIFFYFASLCMIIATISVFFIFSLRDIAQACADKLGHSNGPSRVDEMSNWSHLDLLTYLENQYTVFALSCASSFYCSYYFGTMFELHIWILELAQQLVLCKIVVELSDEANYCCIAGNNSHPGSRKKSWLARSALANNALNLNDVNNNNNNNNRQLNYYKLYKLLIEHDRFNDLHQVANCKLVWDSANDFGGLRCMWQHSSKFLFAKQSKRLKLCELIAIRLLSKKQTLLRATYINMCLFFDELNATRFMTNTILRRTTQIAFGFAMMASVTRSQFQTNYLHLTFLLLSCLLILNCYLAYAAIINTCVSINNLLT